MMVGETCKVNDRLSLFEKAVFRIHLRPIQE
jgi:hypothetical protein